MHTRKQQSLCTHLFNKGQINSVTQGSEINLYTFKNNFLATLEYEKDPSSASNPPFENIIFPSSLGTLYSYQGRHQSKGAQHYGGDHQGTRCLDVT